MKTRTIMIEVRYASRFQKQFFENTVLKLIRHVADNFKLTHKKNYFAVTDLGEK